MPKYSPFQRKHRRAARLSLYSSALLSGLVVFALTRAFDTQLDLAGERSRSLAYWEAHEDVDLLRRYVQIDTSEREIEGARFLAERLRAFGLEPVIEELADGRANVWAILEGKRPEAIVLHSHIDVFEATRLNRWTHPPFSGAIDPPFLYGRGTFDMKSLAVAQLRAMGELAQERTPPEMSVIFLATADEESGSHFGSRWILRQHPELVERFAVVLTEGGVVEPVSVNEVKYWGIETAQKRFATGYACAPDRQLLTQLSDGLDRERKRYRTPQLTGPVLDFLAVYATTRDSARLSETLRSVVDSTVDPLRFRKTPRYLKSLFYNEIGAFPVEALDDGTYRMRLIAHLLPGTGLADVLAERLPAWMTHGIDVRFTEPLGAPFGSPAQSQTFSLLEGILLDRYPGTPVGPHFLAWTATDARFFRQAGIPAYGFSPFLVFNTESYRADHVNERINLPGFVDGVALYVDAVRALAARQIPVQ